MQISATYTKRFGLPGDLYERSSAFPFVENHARRLGFARTGCQFCITFMKASSLPFSERTLTAMS